MERPDALPHHTALRPRTPRPPRPARGRPRVLPRPASRAARHVAQSRLPTMRSPRSMPISRSSARCMPSAGAYHRASEVTAWPTPVIRTTVLLSRARHPPHARIAPRVLAGALDQRGAASGRARLGEPRRSMPVPSQQPFARLAPARRCRMAYVPSRSSRPSATSETRSPPVAILIKSVEPLARRRPHEPAAGELLVEARRVLSNIAFITSRDGDPPLLPLAAIPTGAGGRHPPRFRPRRSRFHQGAPLGLAPNSR